MADDRRTAPGHPGLPPRWTSSCKAGAGTAIGGESPVWFTLSHGILNELYYPRLDCANTRDAGLLVAGPEGFFSEEKRHARHVVEPLEQGVPAYRVTSTCRDGRCRITKTIFSDPRRPAVVMRVRFEVLRGKLEDYRVFVLTAPHIGNQGRGNDGWCGDYRGRELLFAWRRDIALAVGCSTGWRARSCGYVGTSDGWQQVRAHGLLTDEYPEARDGNIALTGEVDLGAAGGAFDVVIGFGAHPDEAGLVTHAALLSNLDETCDEFCAGWRSFQDGCLPLASPARDAFDLYRTSMAVLRTHESKAFHGAIIASLSIPWGTEHGDGEIGGYHLVWPRDQVHAALALLAAGRVAAARQVMFYLMCTQNPAGNWTQNMWVDGDRHWTRNQSDQTASFILLVAALRRHAGDLGTVDPWPAVRRAAEFLLRQGPVTEQDRWEENRGYTPYTLATMVAALAATARLAGERDEAELAQRCRGAADDWNASIERWLFVTDTPLAREVGVDGYYVRLAPPEVQGPDDLRRCPIQLRNYPPERGRFAASEVVSPDALALVRYGLRRGDDPRIAATVRVIDATLRRETKSGPVWRRFTHDGYGEHEDGRPYDGTGVGRGWPVLTGERAHYELARGNRAGAEELLRAMVAQSEPGCGLFPEQIWDGEDRPERALYNGEPAGSAMPLVWAHAEFVTLLRSLRDGQIFDRPADAAERYVEASR